MSVCRNCGKPLTASAIEGIGPECMKKLSIEATTKTDTQYKFARESLISNQGEDIKDSARHRYHEWKNLNDAEMAGEAVARSMINRDKLIKNSPPNIIPTEDNIIAASISTAIIKRMPPEPIHIESSGKYYGFAKRNKTNEERLVFVSPSLSRITYYIKNPETDILKEFDSAEDANRALRKGYYDRYEFIKNNCEDLSKNPKLSKESLSGLDIKSVKEIVKLEVESFFDKFKEEFGIKQEGYGSRPVFTLNAEDRDFYDRYLKGISDNYGRAKKYSLRETLETTFRDVESGGSSKIIGAIEKAMSGGSLSIGTTPGIKGERFNPLIFYSQVLERSGPDLKEKNTEDYLKTINESWKMRGIQFGNTVSDKERVEHLKRVAESFHDLKDVLEISDEDISLGGELALAIGARGRSKALAHFEPDEKAINLTRKNGIGALAHEWGHALESIKYMKGKIKGYSNTLGNTPRDVDASFDNTIRQNERNKIDNTFIINQKEFSKKLKVFTDRMASTQYFKDCPSTHKKYLADPREVFARTFEAMVKYKLDKKKRKNTYLVSCDGVNVYPNKEELESMEPYFDKIIKDLTKK